MNAPKIRAMSIDDSLLKQFIAVTIFSLLTAAGAWIEIPLPFTPVPITLQTVFVILAGASLGAKRGALSQIMYLFYGICGLPVFAGGASSFIQLLGPSGGYLLGFPVAAFLTGLLVSREKSFYWNLGACIIGSLPILLIGSLQLNILIGGNLTEAFKLGFIPFIAGDFIKCVLAAAAFTASKKIMSK
ncbi:biotin transporter BioY [bacterium]|nr:MAG: biotin transporter BioY [bacterium]